MTGVILAMLGATILSGGTHVDRIEALQQFAIYAVEQQKIEEQKQIEQEKILYDVFVVGFIDWLNSLGTIKYRLGHFDVDQKKFDCVGLFKGFAVSRGLLTKEEAGYINSYVMYSLGKPKKLKDAKKGDVTYWHPMGDYPRHIALISRDYNPKDGGIWIIDNAPGNRGRVEERFIKMGGDIFIGKYKISVASNPFIEIAKNKGLEYNGLREYQGYFAMTRYYAPVSGQSTYLPYSPDYEHALQMNCGGDCTNMAGKKTVYSDKNKVVSCPIEYRLGQILKIVDDNGYERLVKCADRGGAIKGKKLDLFAGIGEEGLNNIKHNKVPGGSQHVYKFNPTPKPKNEPTKTLRILNSNGDFAYIRIGARLGN